MLLLTEGHSIIHYNTGQALVHVYNRYMIKITYQYEAHIVGLEHKPYYPCKLPVRYLWDPCAIIMVPDTRDHSTHVI